MTEYKGEHYTIYNADCMEVIRQMPDKSIDLIITDPPYLIRKITGGGTINKVLKQQKYLSNLNSKTDLISSYNIRALATEIKRIMKSINVYFFCNKEQLIEYLDVYVKEMKCKYDILIWNKTDVMPTYYNKYLSDKEYILYFRKGTCKLFPVDYNRAKTVFKMPKKSSEAKKIGHPTIKPLEIVETLILNSSEMGDTVLDPFLGSGTTALAALNNGRKFIGCEKDEDYYYMALRRING